MDLKVLIFTREISKKNNANGDGRLDYLSETKNKYQISKFVVISFSNYSQLHITTIFISHLWTIQGEVRSQYEHLIYILYVIVGITIHILRSGGGYHCVDQC